MKPTVIGTSRIENGTSLRDDISGWAIVIGLLWVLWALWGFATIGLHLGLWSGLGWAVTTLVATAICVGTVVGLIAWPFFVLPIVSGLFGAPHPAAWQSPASIPSLGITIILASGIGVGVGQGIVLLIRRTLSK